MSIQELIAFIALRVASNEINKRNERKERYTTPTKPVSKEDTSKEATFEYRFGNMGCSVGFFTGIFIVSVAITSGASAIWCLLGFLSPVILIPYFFMNIGKIIDWSVKKIKARR